MLKANFQRTENFQLTVLIAAGDGSDVQRKSNASGAKIRRQRNVDSVCL